MPLAGKVRAAYEKYRPRAVEVKKKPPQAPSGKGNGLLGPRNIRESNLQIEDVEPRIITGDTRKDIESWIGPVGMRDPKSRDLIDALAKMDPKSRDRIMETDPLEVLETYRRGLELLGARSYRDFINSQRRNDLSSRITWLGSNRTAFEDILIYSKLFDILNGLNKLQILKANEIKPFPGDLTNIGSFLNTAYYLADNKSDVELIKLSIVEITKLNPGAVAPLLAKEITASTKDTKGDLTKCGIAIEGLKAAGEDGFKALLGLYTNSGVSPAVEIADDVLSLIDHRSGPVYVERRIAKAMAELIKSSPNGDALALLLLKEAGAAGKFKSPSKLTEAAHQKIATSKDDGIREIFASTVQNIETVEELLGVARSQQTMLLGLVKAVLEPYAQELLRDGDFKKAERALQELGKIPHLRSEESRIRLALAYAYFGMGGIPRAVNELKGAIELNQEALTSMFMNLEKIGEIGDENGYLNLGRHLITLETTRKATAAMYVLGYLLVNKRSIGDRWVRAIIEKLMSKENEAIWDHLEDKLMKNQVSEFKALLDKIIAELKTPLVLLGTSRKIHDSIQETLNAIGQTLG